MSGILQYYAGLAERTKGRESKIKAGKKQGTNIAKSAFFLTLY